jgi:predicted transcriptional regulator
MRNAEVSWILKCLPSWRVHKQKRMGGPRVSDNPAAPAIRSMVAEIVSSYLKKNQIAPADIPALINTVYHSLLAAGKAPEQSRAPAVPIRQSVRPNYVVCLECGRRAKMLRRHLRDTHGLSPEQYRARWRLSSDYPLTAPAYSEQRSAMAKEFGLGRGATGRRPRGRKQPTA